MSRGKLAKAKAPRQADRGAFGPYLLNVAVEGAGAVQGVVRPQRRALLVEVVAVARRQLAVRERGHLVAGERPVVDRPVSDRLVGRPADDHRAVGEDRVRPGRPPVARAVQARAAVGPLVARVDQVGAVAGLGTGDGGGEGASAELERDVVGLLVLAQVPVPASSAPLMVNVPCWCQPGPVPDTTRFSWAPCTDADAVPAMPRTPCRLPPASFLRSLRS